MDRKEKKPAATSVPQFGGWDQKDPGATNYSMVFTQARANRKHQKTDLTEIKRKGPGDEKEFKNANQGQAHHTRGHAHGHARAKEDPVVMGKKRVLTYINCCIRP